MQQSVISTVFKSKSTKHQYMQKPSSDSQHAFINHFPQCFVHPILSFLCRFQILFSLCFLLLPQFCNLFSYYNTTTVRCPLLLFARGCLVWLQSSNYASVTSISKHTPPKAPTEQQCSKATQILLQIAWRRRARQTGYADVIGLLSTCHESGTCDLSLPTGRAVTTVPAAPAAI